MGGSASSDFTGFPVQPFILDARVFPIPPLFSRDGHADMLNCSGKLNDLLKFKDFFGPINLWTAIRRVLDRIDINKKKPVKETVVRTSFWHPAVKLVFGCVS